MKIPSSLRFCARHSTTTKTGNTLTAIEIDNHLSASGIPDVDLKESRTMTTRLTRNGLIMLEIILARLALFSIGTSETAPLFTSDWALLYTNPCGKFCQVPHQGSGGGLAFRYVRSCAIILPWSWPNHDRATGKNRETLPGDRP